MADGTHNYLAGRSITITTTGNIDNLDLDGVGMLLMNNASASVIRGLQAGFNGKILGIFPLGAGSVTVNHQDTNSSAANRIITNTALAVVVNSGLLLQYDGATQRWKVLAHANAAVLHARNVFTDLEGIRIERASTVRQYLKNTSAAADQKVWVYQVSGTTFSITTLNDAEDTPLDLLLMSRTGNLTLVGNISAFAGQIGFPATQNPSSGANDLDDYEEGSWTPVIGGTGGVSGQTYLVQTGRYQKVGKLVAVQFEVALSNKGTITSNVQIQGLPFTATATPSRPCYPLQWAGLATNWVFIIGLVLESTTTILVRGAAAAATTADTSLVTADISNSTFFRGAAVYEAAN